MIVGEIYSMSIKEKLINIKNADEMLDVSKETLRNWDRSGKLISVRTCGNHRRYRLIDILTFFEKENENN
jgi:predicted site-specific integrase-resolvase